MKKLFILLLSLSYLCTGCKNNDNQQSSEENTSAESSNIPAAINYKVVNIYPHDTAAYTEGLFWQEGFLYESTGEKGSSFIVKRTLSSARAVQKKSIDGQFFGEGITILNGKLFELTWQEHKVFVYDAKTWDKITEFSWPMEGWGMTTDGKYLIITTGDSNLYFVDPSDFKIVRTVGVSDNYGPVGNLNEVEYVDGFIYANVFQTDAICKINAETGAVTGRIDLTDINQKNGVNYTPGGNNGNSVLNGIAYNARTKTFYVTGKNWPKIFELQLQ